MKPEEVVHGRLSDWYTVFGFLVLHMVINLWTAGLYPVPWFDEVCLADPGVNLFYGSGFFSSACREWVGPPRPLYPFALAVWLKMWGFSLVSVRSFSYLCAVGAVIFVLIGANRLALIQAKWQRLLLVMVCLWAYSTAFAYRAARMEPLIIMIICGCFAAATIRSESIRRWVLCFLGLTLGVAGLQALVFLAAASVVSIFLRPKEFRNVAFTVFGSALFGTALLAFGSHQFGVDFSQSATGAFFRNSLAGAVMAAGHEYSHVNKIPKAPDFYVLLIVLSSFFLSPNRMSVVRRSGVFIFFGVTLVFVIFAHLPTYYACFAVFPAVIAIVSELRSSSRRGYIFQVIALGIVVFSGLPFQIGVGFVNRAGRDTQGVCESIGAEISPADTVYADYSAYYAVKAICPRSSFFGYYLERISDRERAAVDVLIVSPRSANDVIGIIGGRWELKKVIAVAPKIRWRGWSRGTGLLESNFDLVLFRRVRERT